ncbi:P-loop NTPase fold protein [Nocardia sp. NPDC049149]|uniref:P-loop NTPase fold protein n=1 Tax=Nocardia sp. NPDC049149 TaxID=3364315 RepID=UPI0037158114
MRRIAAYSILTGQLEPTTELKDLARVAVDLLHADETPDPPVDNSVDAAECYFRSASILEGDSVVAIVGERGSGKTTLLTTVCRFILENTDDVLLPITRPESFRSTDSLISVFVSHLRELIEIGLSHEQRTDNGAADPKIALLIQQVLKSAALTAPRTIDVLSRSSDSLSQYALDAVGLIKHSDQLGPLLRNLVSQTRVILRKPVDCPIVVPLDDADLVPHRTVEILSDLRTLSSIPGVIPLICIDGGNLQRHLEADLSREYGPGLHEGHVRALARQQIIKTIRPANSIAPPYLRPGRRLAFAPLLESETLLSLLRKILGLLDPTGVEAHAIIEWLVDSEIPTTLNSVTGVAWLPDTPRSLENLWRVSYELESALRNSEMWSIGPWLSRWLDEICARADYGLRLDVERVEIVDGAISIEASTAWTSGLLMNVLPSGAWRTVIDDSTVRLRIRRFWRPALSLPSESKDKDSMTEADLGSGAASSFLLLQDIFRLSGFAEPRPRAASDISSTDFFFLQSIKMAGQNTDDLFFLFPISVGAVYTQRSHAIWNSLYNSLYGSHLADHAKLALFIRRYVALILRSWWSSQGAEEILSDDPPDMFQLIDSCGRVYLKEEGRYGGRVRDSYTPGKAFCHWFETGLPYVFHQLLFPEDINLPVLIETWLKYLTVARRGAEGLDELRSNLRSRIEKNVTPPTRIGKEGLWLCGYTALFDQVDSDMRGSIEHLLGEYEKLRGRGVIGKTSTSDAVEVVADTSSYSFAETATAEGVAERELIASVLAQLRR